MSALLRIFEAKALAEELTNAGHYVSERTAQRWKKGETEPKPQDVRAIVRLVLSLAENEEEAAQPEWAGRLEAKVDQLVIEGLDDPVLQTALRGLVSRLGVLPKPSAEGFGDLLGKGGRGTRARGGRGAS